MLMIIAANACHGYNKDTIEFPQNWFIFFFQSQSEESETKSPFFFPFSASSLIFFGLMCFSITSFRLNGWLRSLSQKAFLPSLLISSI